MRRLERVGDATRLAPLRCSTIHAPARVLAPVALLVALLVPLTVAGRAAPAHASTATADYGTGHEMSADPNGGYWLSDTAGDVTAYGTASTFGSMSGHPLNRPVVSMAATPDGRGTGWWRPTAASSPSATRASTARPVRSA